MRFYTPLIEFSGITTVWINKISKWERANGGWVKVEGGPGFIERGLSHNDFHDMLQKLFDKRFPYEDSDGYSPRMYRAWVSGNTLNVVQRKMTKNKDGTYNVE